MRKVRKAGTEKRKRRSDGKDGKIKEKREKE